MQPAPSQFRLPPLLWFALPVALAWLSEWLPGHSTIVAQTLNHAVYMVVACMVVKPDMLATIRKRCRAVLIQGLFQIGFILSVMVLIITPIAVFRHAAAPAVVGLSILSLLTALWVFLRMWPAHATSLFALKYDPGEQESIVTTLGRGCRIGLDLTEDNTLMRIQGIVPLVLILVLNALPLILVLMPQVHPQWPVIVTKWAYLLLLAPALTLGLFWRVDRLLKPLQSTETSESRNDPAPAATAPRPDGKRKAGPNDAARPSTPTEAKTHHGAPMNPQQPAASEASTKARHPDLSRMRELARSGHDFNQFTGDKSPLMELILSGHGDRARTMALLFEQDINLDYQDAEGNTALHHAVAQNDEISVDKLIVQQADLDRVNQRHMTPLTLACHHGYWNICRQLIKAGAQLSPADAMPPLVTASCAREDDCQGVDLLLSAGADCNATDKLERTALMNAAMSGNALIADRLLKAGANIDRTDQFSNSALMEAARSGANSVIERFVFWNPNTELTDKLGRTALLIAVASRRSNAETIRLLIALGANPRARNAEGAEAADIAVASGRMQIAKALGMDSTVIEEVCNNDQIVADETDHELIDIAELVTSDDHEWAHEQIAFLKSQVSRQAAAPSTSNTPSSDTTTRARGANGRQAETPSTPRTPVAAVTPAPEFDLMPDDIIMSDQPLMIDLAELQNEDDLDWARRQFTRRSRTDLESAQGNDRATAVAQPAHPEPSGTPQQDVSSPADQVETRTAPDLAFELEPEPTPASESTAELRAESTTEPEPEPEVAADLEAEAETEPEAELFSESELELTFELESSSMPEPDFVLESALPEETGDSIDTPDALDLEARDDLTSEPDPREPISLQLDSVIDLGEAGEDSQHDELVAHETLRLIDTDQAPMAPVRSTSTGRETLIQAARDENTELMDAVLMSTDEVDPQWMTAAFLAAINEGCLLSPVWLLDHGLDANAECSNGLALIDAILQQARPDPQIIEALIRHGARIDHSGEQIIWLSGMTDFQHQVSRQGMYDQLAEQYKTELLATLVENGSDFKVLDDTRRTALHWAVRYRNKQFVSMLIEMDLNVNQQDDDGNTPLIEAVRSSNPDRHAIIRLLISAGADPLRANAAAESAMTISMNSNDRTISRLLMMARINEETVAGQVDDRPRDLLLAAQNGNLGRIKRLLGRGDNVNIRDDDGATPLIHASGMGNMAAMSCLLSADANPGLATINGTTALGAAVLGGHRDAVKLLVGHGVPVDQLQMHKVTPLMLAAARWNSSMVSLLLELGANPNATDASGDSALMAAAQNAIHSQDFDHGRQIFETLIQHQARPDLINDEGQTALMMLLGVRTSSQEPINSKNLENLTAMLITAGAQLDTQDLTGWSALHAAAAHGLHKPARLLIQAGANKRLRDINGLSACDLAMDNNDDRLVQLFL